MSQARHIDQDARMLWLTLCQAPLPLSVAELVLHWRPTFRADEVRDALTRLQAHGCARRVVTQQQEVWMPGETVLPGMEASAA